MTTSTIPPKRKILRGQGKGRRIEPEALAEVRALLGDTPRRRDLLIEGLHLIQDKYGHLSARHLTALAHELGLSNAEVFEVATFYHHFDVVKNHESPPPALTVRVCDSITCEMFGADQLVNSLSHALGNDIRIQRVPCVGRCETAPVAVVGNHPVKHATLDRVIEAVHAGRIKPEREHFIDYDQYCADGGYQSLARGISGILDGEHIICELENAQLRGLGGAGFPVGKKWHIVKDQPAPRLMAVNIDEGEPGTFKDRYYLERDPHRFLEGMLIAAHVVGIEEIYIYLRDEYAGCRELLTEQLSVMKTRLPHAVPPIHLRRGAGAYICGEESAMIESIEGKRGMPRLRPPYVAQVGLFGRPTLEHNMESLYWVREIIEKGAAWFASNGRQGRKGLRSFSVSGRVQQPGVHLAPAGITVRELIAEYCGGMLPGHTFYGYFPGGASGGILPATLGDVPLDFDTLNDHGCFIGSAAIIILSDKDRARRPATNAMRFFAHESCGKCTPCRVGTAKAVKLMEQPVWDQTLMNELAQVMADASICGLGQAAANPMQCVMKYFPEELGDGSKS